MKVTFVTYSGSIYSISSDGTLSRNAGEDAATLNTMGIVVRSHSPIVVGDRVNINHWPFGDDSILTTTVVSIKVEDA